MSWVLFFDGECGLCSRSVRWVARWDRRGRISFAPLQGELAREQGFSRALVADGGTLVLLRESDGRVFVRSDGWLEVARALGGWWRILTLGRIVPRGLRDFIYRQVARNRHRIGGQSDGCALADPAVLQRLRK